MIALGLNPTCIGQIDCGVTKGLRSAVFVDAGRNTTGNLADARKGYVATVHLEQAGGWLRGDYDYYEATLEGRSYVALGTRAVLAFRARGGSIDSLRPGLESPVPFFKRYFLGGATNLRGWGRFDVSPLSGSGLPIGGQTTMNFSAEARIPLVGNLGGVAVSRRRQRLGRFPGTSTSTISGTTWVSGSDTTRASAHSASISATSSIRFRGCW